MPSSTGPQTLGIGPDTQVSATMDGPERPRQDHDPDRRDEPDLAQEADEQKAAEEDHE